MTNPPSPKVTFRELQVSVICRGLQAMTVTKQVFCRGVTFSMLCVTPVTWFISHGHVKHRNDYSQDSENANL